jgi:hypothetical protein
MRAVFVTAGYSLHDIYDALLSHDGADFILAQTFTGRMISVCTTW